MAPAGQGQTWSDVLCCINCNEIFSAKVLPINLTCGHVICVECSCGLNPNICPLDEIEGELSVDEYPVNSALYWIATGEEHSEGLTTMRRRNTAEKSVLTEVEQSLISLATYLKRADSERGGTVFSEVLSRTMQRKLVALLCFQLVEEEGRSRALKTCRAMADRVMTEILLSQQVPSHLSTQLWTAVRSRGCQFLGPAMQEDVLKLILLALGQGAPIARKTLVMYVVQMLSEDYPQVSKTCVGHVVQLLYRASCFNVLKREGESSLMQMKEEFRTYDALRREHDAQIVQMAMEAGLRISPDQWSALLYGDAQHRSHMQSIIDKLQSPQAYQQGLDELRLVAGKGDRFCGRMIPLLEMFVDVHPTHHERISWSGFSKFLGALVSIVEYHGQYNLERADQRNREQSVSNWKNGAPRSDNSANPQQQRYKTQMCRDILSGGLCPRGARCTWAHSEDEMRENRERARAANGSCQGGGGGAGSCQGGMQPMGQSGMRRGPNGRGPPPNGMMRYRSGQCAPMQQPPPMMNHQMAPPPPIGVQMVQGPPPPVGVVFQQNNQQAMPQPGEMIPVMPVVVQSPTHHVLPMQDGSHMLMMGPPPPQNGGRILMSHNPPNGLIWQSQPPPPPQPGGAGGQMAATQQPPGQLGAPPQPAGQLAAAHQAVILQPQQAIPQSPPRHFQPHAGFWMTPSQPAVFQPIDNSSTPAAGDGKTNGWGRTDAAAKTEQDADQLFLKRKEIISRLAPLTLTDDEDCDDTFGHVSYTVASSVLEERVDLYQQQHPIVVVGAQPPMELPHMPANFAAAVLPTSVHGEDILIMNDGPAQHVRPRATSVPRNMVQVSSAMPGCMTSVYTSDSVAPATVVQADCGPMRVHETINQPLATPVIQYTQGMMFVPATAALDPCGMSDRLPTIRPQPIMVDAQGVVSNTLDKIVDVKERLNEAGGAPGSCAVSQQLRVELQIAEREMESLDVRTQASCLLRELHQVDQAIGRIEGTRPSESEE